MGKKIKIKKKREKNKLLLLKIIEKWKPFDFLKLFLNVQTQDVILWTYFF
jgi:hypothetical protein